MSRKYKHTKRNDKIVKSNIKNATDYTNTGGCTTHEISNLVVEAVGKVLVRHSNENKAE